MGEIQKRHRRSIRLPGYDYSSPGEYFITTMTYHCQSIFGKVVNGEMKLSKFGEIANKCWYELPKHFCSIEIEPFVIMPNHIHGIITITKESGRGTAYPDGHYVLCPYRGR